MKLAVGIIVLLLTFYLCQKFAGRFRKGAEKRNAPSDKAGLSPAISLVLRKQPDDPRAEPGETITLTVTQRDTNAFHNEWEVIPDSEADEDRRRPDSFHSKTLH